MRGVWTTVILLLALGVAQPATADGRYYPLVCKTAPSIILQQSNEYWKPKGIDTGLTYNNLRATFYIRFAKARQKAGNDGAGIGAGECAWVDRPLAEDEPSCAYFSPEASPAMVVPRGWEFRNDGIYHGARPNIMQIEELAKYLTFNRSSGKRFQFNARRDGLCFEIENNAGWPRWTVVP